MQSCVCGMFKMGSDIKESFSIEVMEQRQYVVQKVINTYVPKRR